MLSEEQITNKILVRCYLGAFTDVDWGFPLAEFAEENGIDHEKIWKIFEKVEEKGLIKCEQIPAFIEPTPAGLLYVEDHELADSRLINKQRTIRKDLLTKLFDLQQTVAAYEGIYWEDWVSESGVEVQDFNNNEKILMATGLIENQGTHYFKLTPKGRAKVIDYRKRLKRANEFEALCNLEGVTPQQRGHKLEDLLADSAEWEGWEVQRRVRAQGTENDIIMHVGRHYFISSCKWEADTIQPEQVELLESRVRSRAQTNGGILFTMSGLTQNAIDEIRFKVNSALIVVFGPMDIRQIMNDESKMTALIDEKLDVLINHRKILIDGETLGS